MTTKALTLNNLEQKIVWLCLAGILLLSFFYIYFINSSIIDVAAKERSDELISITETEISGLVSDYIFLSKTVDLEGAKRLGLTDVSAKTVFVTRRTPTQILTLLDNEI